MKMNVVLRRKKPAYQLMKTQSKNFVVSGPMFAKIFMYTNFLLIWLISPCVFVLCFSNYVAFCLNNFVYSARYIFVKILKSIIVQLGISPKNVQ